jgi:hypothetical protein
MKKQIPEMEVIYKFARGDLNVKEFEAWLYNHQELEALLGQNLYLDLVSTNYSNSGEVDRAINNLVAWSESRIENSCLCRAIRNNDRKIIGQQEWLFTTTFSTVRRRTPWIRLDNCNDCGDYWLIATDPTYDDESFFCRIDEQPALEVVNKGYWVNHPVDRDVFWPTEEWLKLNGFSSLKDWQFINECPVCSGLNENPRSHCYNNRKEVEASAICGCLKCLSTFDVSKVTSWTDKVLGIERTALCPICLETSVIGNKAGVTIDRQSLSELKLRLV